MYLHIYVVVVFRLKFVRHFRMKICPKSFRPKWSFDKSIPVVGPHPSVSSGAIVAKVGKPGTDRLLRVEVDHFRRVLPVAGCRRSEELKILSQAVTWGQCYNRNWGNSV
jgi:hypothetical protein